MVTRFVLAAVLAGGLVAAPGDAQEKKKKGPKAGAAVEAAPAIRAEYRTQLPLVCAAADKEPLADVLKTLGRVYDLNVVVHPSARAAVKNTLVTEQLLNVPADTALELLVDQA